MIVGNNELFTCPGQILCALIIDLNDAPAGKYSVIISNKTKTSGYYLTFLKTIGNDPYFNIEPKAAIKAKVFYIE